MCHVHFKINWEPKYEAMILNCRFIVSWRRTRNTVRKFGKPFFKFRSVLKLPFSSNFIKIHEYHVLELQIETMALPHKLRPEWELGAGHCVAYNQPTKQPGLNLSSNTWYCLNSPINCDNHSPWFISAVLMHIHQTKPDATLA